MAAFAVAALLALLTLWKGPQWQVARIHRLNRKERFDRENEARRTLATILGGVAILAGGFFTWRNIKLAQDAQSISLAALQISQEGLQISQEGQITDRYTKAIEQLGATDSAGRKKMEVRLGAIYALERISVESERDFYWPVMEVLTAYVRENARRTESNVRSNKAAFQKPTWKSNGNWMTLDLSETLERPRPTPDVQAILDVIARRRHSFGVGEKNPLNLSLTNLAGASLRKANLEGVDLTAADLTMADLTSAQLQNANLSMATLDRARLTGANLQWANLIATDLRGTNLGPCDNLTQDQVDVTVVDASTALPLGLHNPPKGGPLTNTIVQAVKLGTSLASHLP